MSDREFYEVDDIDRDFETAFAWVKLTPADMGRVVATFRPWPTWRLTGWVVGGGAVVTVLCLVVPVGDLPLRIVAALTFNGLGPFLYVAATLLGSWDRFRVCEKGLVLGRFRSSGLVVPWETIDPGRVRVVERLFSAGFHPDVQAGPTSRVGGFTDRGLALNGVNTATWEPRWVNWILGTRQPERLAEAIEQAMIADGFPAQGLAANAKRTAVTARRGTNTPLLQQREPKDPVIGVR